ncbi:Tyrosine recombinase XerC [subsurface metagenome]
MALLMLDAGLRVGEVVQLKVSDLIFNRLPVKTLTVSADIAKTKEERTVPISSRLSGALTTLSETFFSQGHEDFLGYAFFRTNYDEPMTTRQVERIIRTAALKSIGRPVHPHMLRHTFATRIWRKAGERTTQELLGHQNIISTMIYTHPNYADGSSGTVSFMWGGSSYR